MNPQDRPRPEPTPTPEPTPEPFNDPYAVVINDYDEVALHNFSFDTIKFNGQVQTDGQVGVYRLEIEDTVDGKDGSIQVVTMRGWVGYEEEAIQAI